jgi:predicted tellurium resistance membrane protein TerC
MDALFTSEGILALLTPTFLEIILGVDNVIFISIISS